MAEFQALLTAKAEWKPHQIAKAGDIAGLAEAAAALADTVKSALSLSRNGMEVVKLLSVLQNINPLLTALDALADEVLKQIQDLKNGGYWYLYIDPYYNPNVTPKASFDLGFEQLRDEAGKRWWEKKDKDGNWKRTIVVPAQHELDSKTARPDLVSPRSLIPGGYNWFDPIPDPLDNKSKYPRFTTHDVVKEMVKAFDDEGDIPRYRKNKKISILPAKGSTVWDVDGQPLDGEWDPDKDYGLELFDLGITHPDVESGLLKDKGAGIMSEIEAKRKPLNTRETPGKPNIRGNTKFDGGSGAIAVIIGASDFGKFTSVFNEFAKMFSDIPELTPGITGMSILDTFTSIIDPDPVKVKIIEHDLKFGQFVKGDIVGGEKYNTRGKVTEVDEGSIKRTEIKGERSITVLDDLGEPLKKDDGTVIEVIEEIDGNPATDEYPNGRYVNMEISIQPIRNIKAQEMWVGGDMIMEMEKRGVSGEDEDPNYVFVGIETKGLPQNQRVYPKQAFILKETLQALPKPVQPDFGGILIDDIVPGWGEFFQELENFVKQIKGYISNSQTFIDEMIAMIAQIEAYLQHLIDLINKFLEFFRITLPSEGVYALYIPNQNEGNEGLKKQLSEAAGIPTLDYASGILFVGTEGDKLIAGGGSKNPIDLLALVLGLLDSDEPVAAAGTEGKSTEELAKEAAAALGQAAEGSDKDEWKEKSTGEKLASMLLR